MLTNRFKIPQLRFNKSFETIPRNFFSTSSKKVVVAMSGGVDSSVTALLLKQQGYDVTGIFMHNWDEGNGVCTSKEDWNDVQKVAETIGIPVQRVEFVKEYWNNVFQGFLESLQKGYTPNPDYFCNKEIKFKALFKHAKSMGADFLATGHYARIRWQGDEPQLVRGLDSRKDQSYFLAGISHSVFRHVLFPIGDLPKTKVREIAREHKLITSEKKDSVGLCFIGKRNFKEFIGEYVEHKPGDIVDISTNKIIGTHSGLHLLTLGERVRIGGLESKMYVCEKDVETNRVYVCKEGDHHLYFTSLRTEPISWIGSELPQKIIWHSFSCQLRYQSPVLRCRISILGNTSLKVNFLEPARVPTPGQVLALYDGDVCLGGAVIETTTRLDSYLNKAKKRQSLFLEKQQQKRMDRLLKHPGNPESWEGLDIF